MQTAERTERMQKEDKVKFQDLDLDSRLLKAIQDLNFSCPTLIQATAIPLALQGKDILAKAKTGSGKTLAYLLPILQKIILDPSSKAIILVPTKELANQVFQVANQLLKFLTLDSKITILNLVTFSISDSFAQVEQDTQIIIGTPARVKSITLKINLENLSSLAIDEADLITSFGYYNDLQEILQKLPKIYQTWLMSATLSPDVLELKKLVLKNPAILQLQEEESSITQFMVKTTEMDKFLILYFLIKLRISPIGNGKILVFVNSIERCYKLKLFLEQFGIKATTLNSELPVASRFHIVQEFNRGIYDLLIATDESNESTTNQKMELEYGVYRGIDFKNVKAVINFDIPKSSKSYSHRIGRTGRGNDKGYSLTFYVQGSPVISCKKDMKMPSQDKVFSKIEKIQKENGNAISEFKFDMTQVEAFRYRVEDALRAVTGANVRDAHMKDIKHEILNSEKLKAHFENRPKDLEALRHDKIIHPSRIQHQLKHVPDYLLPKRAGVEYSGFVPFTKKKRSGDFRKKGSLKRKRDPLKSF